MKLGRLPRDWVFDGSSFTLRCPWCRADIEDAPVRLGSLLNAFVDGEALSQPWRSQNGQADPSAVTVECETCLRPSMLALQRHHGAPRVRLLAVRTEADLRLIGEPIGRPL